ncbi:hypothetical protein [Streptomyces sp. NPDC001530]|uniref:hypothetical protein n=1 Tax=Streptomyces sp. NPDC001530 TaxID=3364582 RepID=UPI0036B1C30B
MQDLAFLAFRRHQVGTSIMWRRPSMRSATLTRSTTAASRAPSETPERQSSVGVSLGIAAVAAVFHVATVLVVHVQTRGAAQFPDARGYDEASTQIAAAWAHGESFSMSLLSRLSGSEMWGYQTVMALGKIMTGGDWLAAKVVLALMAATGAPAAHRLGVTAGCGNRRAAFAGLIVSVSPNLLLWDAWGLKDGLLTTLVLWTLLLQAKARFWLACAGSLLSIQACLYTRPAAALFLVVALLSRARLSRSHLTGWLIIGAAAAFFLLPRATTLFSLVGSLEVKEGVALDFSAGYGSRNLLRNPEQIFVCLFGPFPWSFGPNTAGPMRWLYLGTTIWIASLALAPAALRKGWADTTKLGRPLILASIAYTSTYIVTFGATFFRQRSLLECMLITLIALYLPLSPAAAMKRIHMWLAVVAGLAVVQSPNLTPTMWSKVLAVCVLIAAGFMTLRPCQLNNLARRF